MRKKINYVANQADTSRGENMKENGGLSTSDRQEAGTHKQGRTADPTQDSTPQVQVQLLDASSLPSISLCSCSKRCSRSSRRTSCGLQTLIDNTRLHSAATYGRLLGFYSALSPVWRQRWDGDQGQGEVIYATKNRRTLRLDQVSLTWSGIDTLRILQAQRRTHAYPSPSSAPWQVLPGPCPKEQATLLQGD
ncbi:uncharacterized protein [Procambarus clarkii]|uniref:uncharacterized protein n=1 Tax=Procambarus clarkii TaxID=6728 RepID=UPI003744AD3F